MFTVSLPERPQSNTVLQPSAVVEERALALWSGTATDFGVGVTLSDHRWTLRSITSMTSQPLAGHDRPTFQQFEIIRPVLSIHSVALAGGGGIRQEWDGTRVLVGRVVGGADLGPGRLQGSLIVERAVASPVRHDAADLVTTLGWTRPIGPRLAVGMEGIGQDLEGFWNPAEADGGAKLLVGPSLHAQSKSGAWAASLTAGPVVQTLSTALAPRASGPTAGPGRRFGMFASAIWVPSLRR